MMTFIIVIHAITCILLVLTVLMQSGRGGGLTESFSSAESVFGAQTSTFMVKATGTLATIFFATSLILAFLSARQDRSLMDSQKTAPVKQTSASKSVASEPQKEAVQAVKDELPSAEVPASVSKALDQAADVLANTQQ